MSERPQTPQLEGRTLALLIADGTSRTAVMQLREAFESAGGRVLLLAPRLGEVRVVDDLTESGTVPVDQALLDADLSRYGALVLPGGIAGVDRLRRDPDAVALVGAALASALPVAAVGHAPWLLIEAGVVRGRALTGWPSLKTDIINAGGSWVDEPVHADGRLITARAPEPAADLCAAIAAAAGGAHAHVLLVAHRTAATPRLLDAVRARAGRGPCDFTLLIPRPYWDPDTEETAATFELALPLLAESAGGHVRGVLGATDPLEAVRETASREQFDEVIVSTLPAHISRWLRLDLPHRIEQLGLPVTVVTADRSRHGSPPAA